MTEWATFIAILVVFFSAGFLAGAIVAVIIR